MNRLPAGDCVERVAKLAKRQLITCEDCAAGHRKLVAASSIAAPEFSARLQSVRRVRAARGANWIAAGFRPSGKAQAPPCGKLNRIKVEIVSWASVHFLLSPIRPSRVAHRIARNAPIASGRAGIDRGEQTPSDARRFDARHWRAPPMEMPRQVPRMNAGRHRRQPSEQGARHTTISTSILREAGGQAKARKT